MNLAMVTLMVEEREREREGEEGDERQDIATTRERAGQPRGTTLVEKHAVSGSRDVESDGLLTQRHFAVH